MRRSVVASTFLAVERSEIEPETRRPVWLSWSNDASVVVADD